ncbi:aldehyde dehydrogenase (NADP(+)) [Fibrella sp. USSR17]
MHSFTGQNFIGSTTSSLGENSFQAFSTLANDLLPGSFHQATSAELEQALRLADTAFPIYSELPYAQRADFLDAIADEIMDLGQLLLERCSAESGLPLARITGERGRTCGQLRLFAQLLRDGWWADARIETAQPDRAPLPKSDIRRMLIPIGPVAVFGASNFPLAFSTAGGDTASALAAGCPVVVKAHSSHPGTNELISTAIIRAAQKTGMPDGVFSSVYLSHADVIRFVQHPTIKAVGFTGSRQVGMQLFNAAVSRPDPIPVYAEMSAVNPVVLLEQAVREVGEKIAGQLAASVVLGAGQFCTNPGLVLLVDSEAAQQFLTHFAQQMGNTVPATMLNRNIHNAYVNGISALQSNKAVNLLAVSEQHPEPDRYEAQPAALVVRSADFLADKALGEEVFGPATLVVLCSDTADLLQVLTSLEGQLTATVHALPADEPAVLPILRVMAQKAGRVIYGGYPTGVEVCHAMQHGGPFPATTDGRSTSVGTAAINRFVRPVAYQDVPDHLLPALLQNSNPLNSLRLINGSWTQAAL